MVYCGLWVHTCLLSTHIPVGNQFQNPLDSRGKRDKNSTRFVFYCWKSINRIVGAKDFRCFVMRNLNFLPHISKPANGNVRPYVPKIRHYSRATAGLRILLKSIPNKEEQSLSLALSVWKNQYRFECWPIKICVDFNTMKKTTFMLDSYSKSLLW